MQRQGDECHCKDNEYDNKDYECGCEDNEWD